jgi:pimeloyl-ACP methyl ester carboxylesterase
MADIIFVHGMWSHGGVAEPLCGHLEEAGHQVFSPSLPGHDARTASDWKTHGRRSIHEYVAFVENFIAKQKFVQPPILIGHSMGGLIAQIVAARVPVRGLALLNSAAPAGINHIYPGPVYFFRKTLLTPRFWSLPTKPSFDSARKGLFHNVDPDKAAEIYATLVPESGRCFFEMVFWWLNFRAPTRVRNATRTPLFIVCSGKDKVVAPSVAFALTKRYPQAEFQLFPDNGHWIFHEEGEEAIYEAIEWWIAATFDGEESSIRESHHLPHDASRSTSATTQLSPDRPARLVSNLDDTGALRGNAHEDAEAGGGALLPR